MYLATIAMQIHQFNELIATDLAQFRWLLHEVSTIFLIDLYSRGKAKSF